MDIEKQREQKRVAAKKFRAAHPELIKQNNREQYEKNRQKRIEYAREYYLKNKDKRQGQDKKRYEQNKELQSKKYKEFRRANPDFVRERDRSYRLRKQYGITVVELAELWTSQDGKCANTRCRTTLFRGLGGYAIDHCHQSNKVRGLLCMRCNVSLGHVNDDVQKLIGLIFYLRKSQHGTQ
jgi:Recombination endonuclease VII